VGWGNPQTAGGLTSYSSFGYAGGYTNTTGLIYFINRYYDPATGVFLSVDQLIATTQQPYQYASDNSVNATDPSGACWFCLIESAYWSMKLWAWSEKSQR
jgi:RHS repeat-associated protein